MTTFLAEQFVRLRPDLTGFRGTVEREAAAAVAGEQIIIPGQLQLSGLEGLGTAATDVENLSASLGGVAAQGAAAEQSVGGFADTLGVAATTSSALAAGTGRAAVAEQRLIAATVEETTAVEAATAAESNLIRTRIRRSTSVGLFRFAGIGLAAGAALFAATQAVGAFSESLAVSGNEADTAGGRLRNFASNVLTGNFVGAVTAAANSTHEFTLAEIEAIDRSPELAAALESIGKSADFAEARLRALEQLTKIPATIQLPIVQAQASGNTQGEIAALREADQAVTRQIAEARGLNVDQETLAAALVNLFGQQSSIRDQIRRLSGEQSKAIDEAGKGLERSRAAIGGLARSIGIGDLGLAQLATTVARDGRAAGLALGRELMRGVSAGITEEEGRAITTAKQALADVIREGNIQIQESIRSARTNLESLGDELSQQLAQVIDVGPLGQKLDELRKRLDDLQDDVSKRKLRFDLGDAQRDLEEAQSAVAAFGKLTPEQKKDQEAFLQPFKEKVGDAKAALKEFDLNDAIDAQEKLKKQAQETAEQGIQKLVGRFEAGKISAGEFATLLRQQVAPAIAALPGTNLGFSFTRDFLREVATLVEQAKDLSGFLGGAGTTPGPQSIKPAQTVAQVQRDIRDAQRNLVLVTRDANRLTKEENDKLAILNARLLELIGRLKPRPAPRGPNPPQADALAGNTPSNPTGG